MTISPKVIPPFVIALAASIVLAFVFHDPTWLLGILVGLAQSGSAAAAPPAPGVTQTEVQALADTKASK
jgi:hypothetical protein